VHVVYEPEEPSHPLCGLIAALGFAAARRSPPAVVALACDMPFVTAPLLAWLAGLDGAVMAQAGGRAQPLLGRWPPQGLPLLERALAEGRPLRSALGALGSSLLEESELSRFGDPARLCFNVNDPADLNTAREWLAGGES
jgi:molybdopterin-guanine dinucleotide biosynthesis protein A